VAYWFLYKCCMQAPPSHQPLIMETESSLKCQALNSHLHGWSPKKTSLWMGTVKAKASNQIQDTVLFPMLTYYTYTYRSLFIIYKYRYVYFIHKHPQIEGSDFMVILSNRDNYSLCVLVFLYLIFIILRWPRDTLHLQKLALTSPTSGGRSVGIVRLQTTSHGVFLVFYVKWQDEILWIKFWCLFPESVCT
jgi:hypothetical protein